MKDNMLKIIIIVLLVIVIVIGALILLKSVDKKDILNQNTLKTESGIGEGFRESINITGDTVQAIPVE